MQKEGQITDGEHSPDFDTQGKQVQSKATRRAILRVLRWNM